MELKDQVCSLSLAKELKRLNFKQESLWYWWVDGVGQSKLEMSVPRKDFEIKCIYCSAFTVAELGEMLPDYTRELGNLEIGKCDTDHMNMEKHEKGWWNISYWEWKTKLTKGNLHPHLERESKLLQQADTEANARAKMLIYLIENKLINV